MPSTVPQRLEMQHWTQNTGYEIPLDHIFTLALVMDNTVDGKFGSIQRNLLAVYLPCLESTPMHAHAYFAKVRLHCAESSFSFLAIVVLSETELHSDE